MMRRHVPSDVHEVVLSDDMVAADIPIILMKTGLRITGVPVALTVACSYRLYSTGSCH